ncbi:MULTISPECIES: hypothetical protein [unclassified Massilia]|uniref:hypothetical protein n=1 Tax=unclassified Massilia TaxID=2609279 RepID=UPI001E472FEA|nr:MULTISPECIES: hypothetical protein [unclassified Massilia]
MSGTVDGAARGAPDRRRSMLLYLAGWLLLGGLLGGVVAVASGAPGARACCSPSR